MKKILSVLLSFSMLSPAYAVEVEERGGVKIPSKEEIKATKRYQEIQDWKTVKTKQGYILSNDLYYVQKCSPTWDIHVKEFKKENPHIKNPNVLSIGQIIKVQTCFKEEVVEVVKEEVKEVVQAPKEEKKSNIIMIVSAEHNKAAASGGKFESEGLGLKVEAVKYLKLQEDRLVKLSAGVLLNETKLNNNGTFNREDKNKQVALTGDAAYLFKVNDKLQIGPNLGLLVGQRVSFAQEEDSSNVAAFAGVNVGYKLSEKLALDVKVQNAIESRANVMSTLGLEFNF